ncbi:MAG: type VI secretion system tip protein TssI/VgrG [Polyangiaceae bacterium]
MRVVANGALFRLEGEGIPSDALPVAYEAIESISVPFRVTAEFVTEDAWFEVDKLLRKPLLLTIVNENGETRYFHGIVDRARFVRASGPKLHFGVRLRPALAALAHRVDCRIFQDESIVTIVSQIFDEAGFLDDVQWQLTGSYVPKEFVCQYRESSLDFVSRLFEDAGIFYFFLHKPDGHAMVVGDSNDAFVLTGDAPATILSPGAGRVEAGESVDKFRRTRALRTSQVVMRDYDFEKPQVKPQAAIDANEAWPNVYYEHPAGFLKAAEGKQRAEARMRELRRDADVCEGETSAIGLLPGVPFMVGGAAEDCVNGEYVVTALVTRGRQNLAEVETENFACRNRFEGIPKNAPFAAPRRAPRPRIRGIQTAVVTGPSAQDQSIHVDKYGRIKVRFHWDRLGQFDDTSSCYIRTAQNPTSGSIIHPRVGWEVSVAFIEGDPDRPLVLGRLYNGEKTPPYALPGAQASGSIKSLSSPGGAGNNEIKMNDTGNSQGYGWHAQKDLNITIGHDKVEKVAVDENHTVKVNMNSTVGAGETLQVGGNQSLDVGANLSLKVGDNQGVTIGGNDTSNSDCDCVEKVGGDRAYTVGGNQLTISNGFEQTITGDITRKVGAAQVAASVASIAENVLGNLTTNVGGVTVQLAKGSIGESVSASKNLTSAAAEVHLVKGTYASNCGAAVTSMVGGLHYDKVTGEYAVKAQTITLLGALGEFKVGGTNLKLGGAPIVIKASAIALEAVSIVKMGASLKMGSG